MDRESHINFWYIVAAILAMLLIQQWWLETRRVETIPYSEFQQLLEAGQIAEIQVKENTIRAKLRDTRPDGTNYIDTVRVEPDFAEDLAQYNVEFKGY